MQTLSHRTRQAVCAFGCVAAVLAASPAAQAAPVISRLTPPSALFTFGDSSAPYTSRFLSRQRFDLQVTVRPDADQTITAARFFVDGNEVSLPVTKSPATVPGLPTNTVIFTVRAFNSRSPGVHQLRVEATQSDARVATARGNFEIVPVANTDKYSDKSSYGRRRAKNVIILLGDGMGIAHRTAARLMLHGAAQGKANGLLAMDTFPFTGLVMTHSLNSIVTDSAPAPASATNTWTRPLRGPACVC